MNALVFRAVGIPKGQPRAKACVRGRHAGVYDPGTANDWKTIVRNAAREKWDGVPFDVPVSVRISVFFPRPKYHFKRNGELKEGAPIWHASKPDRDNIDKAILDALVNVGVLKDDCIAAGGFVHKLYHAPGELPGAWIEIDTLGR